MFLYSLLEYTCNINDITCIVLYMYCAIYVFMFLYSLVAYTLCNKNDITCIRVYLFIAYL